MGLLLILVLAHFDQNIVELGKLNKGYNFAGFHVDHLIAKDGFIFIFVEVRAGRVWGYLILLI
jgi:hypothetical protein